MKIKYTYLHTRGSFYQSVTFFRMFQCSHIRKEMRRKIFKKKNFLFLLLTNCLVVSLWFSNLKVQSLIDHLRHVPWLPLLSRGQAVSSLAHVQCLWEWSLQEEKKVMLICVSMLWGPSRRYTLRVIISTLSSSWLIPNKSTKSAEFSNVKHILLSFCCCLVTKSCPTLLRPCGL